MFKKLFAKRPDSNVILSESGHGFAVGRNQTVLEAALLAGIAFPHDCTVGTCGACRSRLVSGKVDAITPFGYTLSREELQAGYVLACQAVPKSDLELSVPIPSVKPRRLSARIAAQHGLTHDIRRVEWDLSEPVSYNAGQYMTLRWPGGAGPRSYSFACAPVAEGSTRATTFIRRVPGGAFTEALFANTLDAVVFEVEAPLGTFWLREGKGPIVLVGGGSGLAPLLALLEDAAARGVRRDALLLFGGRSERDLYCLDEIAAIGARWPGRFEFRPVLSDEQAPGRRFGMVTTQIAEALSDIGGAEQAYLCGPPPMIDAAITELTHAGLSINAIFYDKFTDAGSAGQ